MATSGALSTTNDNIKYKITITENSRNIANNTSSVTVSVRFYRTNTGYTTYGTGTVYCKINGTTYSAEVTSSDKITSSGIVLFSRTQNITHDSDGTKRLTVSAWISHSQFDSSEQSYSVDLTSIPRTTTPTVNDSDVDLGTSITISTPRASSSFTHTLRYAFGSTSGTIASSVATSRSWTIPLSLASQIPNATSGKLTIYCDTYNGSTKIGTKSLVITVRVPSTVVPTISSVTVTETVSGLAEKFGAFVKGKSKLSIKITASGANGSTISSYSTTGGDKTYSGSSFTVNSVTTAGTLTFTVTVKDSRGRTAKTTKSVTIVDYSNPVISKFTVIRANSDGTPNDEGSNLLISYAFNISSVSNKNDKTFTLSMRPANSTTFTTLTSGNVYTADTTHIPAGTINSDMTYTIRLKISDYFSSVTHDIEAPTAFTLVDYHVSGKGISFGKVAESENLMDVNLPARFRNGVTIDSDWVSLTLNTELFGLYNGSANSQPRFKVAGGYVNIIGAVTPLATITTSADTIVFASGIPSAYRPPITLNFVCHGSGMNKWLCQVTTSGTLTLSRYGITEYADVNAGNWLPFAISYAI